MIVLDTDHLSCLEWGSEESANLRARLAEASDRKIVVSIASDEEQIRGWMAIAGRNATCRLEYVALSFLFDSNDALQ